MPKEFGRIEGAVEFNDEELRQLDESTVSLSALVQMPLGDAISICEDAQRDLGCHRGMRGEAIAKDVQCGATVEYLQSPGGVKIVLACNSGLVCHRYAIPSAVGRIASSYVPAINGSKSING